MNHTLHVLASNYQQQSIEIPMIEIELQSYSENTHEFIFNIYSRESLKIIIDNNLIHIIIYNIILTDEILNDLRIDTSKILIPYPIITKLINLFQQRHININIEKHANTASVNEVESMILHIYKTHGFEVTLIDKLSNLNSKLN